MFFGGAMTGEKKSGKEAAKMRYDFTKNNGTVKKRIISFIMCLFMLIASIVTAGVNIFATESDSEYKLKNFELHPDDENPDKTVTLEGMMPKNAKAEVIDVTDEYADTNMENNPDEDKPEDNTDDNTDELSRNADNVNASMNATDTETATMCDADTETATMNDADVEAATTGDAETIADVSGAKDDADSDDEISENEKASEEYVTLAAYDITIKVGKKEYQPTEKLPIKVEITDARISSDENIRLFHIKDDGEKEEITDIEVREGSLSFDATGFSVYEIVKIASGEVTNATSIDQLDGKGFYIYNNRSDPKGVTKYFTHVLSSGKISATIYPDEATIYYFKKIEGTDNQFNIYYLDEHEEKVYLYMQKKAGGSFGFSSQIKDTYNYIFTVKKSVHSEDSFYLSAPSYDDKNPKKQNYWQVKDNIAFQTSLQYTNGDIIDEQGNTHVGSANNEKVYLFSLTFAANYNEGDTDLDGKTYGLMNYTDGRYGYALMAGGSVHALLEVIAHESASQEGITLYVDDESEVTRWTFHSIADDKYNLSAETDSGVKYLAVSGDKLILVDDQTGAAEFQVLFKEKDRIQLKYDDKYVTFKMEDDGQNSNSYFDMSAGISKNTYLNLIDFADVSQAGGIIYSADRVSVSDVPDGARVIVYTRIWDEQAKRYDIYAVDHDGTLHKCYASAGKILWLGDGTNTLEWVFTEYRDKVTKEVNYYYELYNPSSEKYIAPQRNGEQVLSDDTIGINMPGRRNGEFFSNIIAWDDNYYSYIGLKPNDDNSRLIPCSQSNSASFYFATLESLNLSGSLHKVETINNYDYGITIKMQDFNKRDTMSNYLGSNDGGAVTTTDAGILSTNIGDDGYPIMTGKKITTHKGESLAALYSEPVEVNGLFIKSIYESSGYFEFDSCQNFATLKNDQGGDKNTTQYTDTKGRVHNAVDFTVYRELGSSDNSNAATRKHGQFLPYDNIVGKEISKLHKNTYSALTNQEGTKGELPEDDPRKYEKLYNIPSPNYYNGMELEASFVQTVSGLDAWGHDIIFEFTGDDDFWLYVDGELVIDLGGIHSALAGSVNFKTGEVKVNPTVNEQGVTTGITTLKQVYIDNYTTRYKEAHNGAEPSYDEIKTYLLQYFQTEDDDGTNYGCENIFADYSTHTMRIFYMERGAGASNLHMRFNLASVKPGQVVVSKNVIGNGAALLDTSFLEYPFQIYYTAPDPDNPEEEKEFLLGNDDEHVMVSYQNSTQPVTFVEKYRPPGFKDIEAYHNIYFINPTKSAEISFPDETISYRIVECAVDNTLYGNVLINGEAVPEERVEICGNLKSYSSESVTAESRPTISFDNVVNDNVTKDLFITKKLVDADGKEITDDPATFSFRLYLSSVDVEDIDDLNRVDMYNYYVVKSEGAVKYLCAHNHDDGGFIQTQIEYTRDNISDLKDGNAIDGYTLNDISFTTSGFGAISGIPSGYTICVPGLPIGTVFMVTEDINSGYGLDSYKMVEGEEIIEGVSHKIKSYSNYLEQGDNVGKVIAESNPQLEVINKKGYGLTVKKVWSDLDITVAHDPIYVAVYVDGELIEGSVREIASPDTSTYYFWTSLKRNKNGTTRTNFNGYEVREVRLTGNISVDKDGVVTGYSEVTSFESGDSIYLKAERTAEATPDGETAVKEYEYVVSYKQEADGGSTRTDTVTNTRKGGVAVRLFKWNSTTPLKNGKFTLSDSAGNVIGKYTSDSEGTVTMMYNFSNDEVYTLTETAAPDGYVGLLKTLKFKVNSDETVTLLYEDGITPWGDTVEADENWAKWKNGENGITAYVDIYNKPFNLKLQKTDGASNIPLSSAHFALYKQVNSTVGGLEKNKNPMSGFEDLVTVNGKVDICGGNSGRVLRPGTDGTVYFLKETKAPTNYTKLDEDVVFYISALGEPDMISGPGEGSIIETAESFIYTISVKNTKEDPTKNYLTITKIVDGNHGNKDQEFDFTITIEDADQDGYAWSKNGEEQTAKIRSGDSFKMKHGDSVMICIPDAPKFVTVSEKKEDYTALFKLGDVEEKTYFMRFKFTQDVQLLVTNTREAVIPTGIETHATALIAVGILLIGAMLLFLRGRRRRYNDE